MENSSDLDLEWRVQRWRRSMKADAGIRDADIEELESHLRDSMDKLSITGLTNDEVFLVASQRIGPPNELGEQYDAVHHGDLWKTRVYWMIIGILGYWALSGVSGTFAKTVMLSGTGRGIEGLSMGYLSAFVYPLAFLTIGWLALKYFAGRSCVRPQSDRSASSNASLKPILWLSLSCMLLAFANASLDTIVTRLHQPTTLGGYYLATNIAAGPLSYIIVVGLGILYARRKLQLSPRSLCSVGMVLVLTSTACSPDPTSDVAASKSEAASSHLSAAKTQNETAFERCIGELANDPKVAVASFMELDLAAGNLFTLGTPLSFSETEFVNLPAATREKISSVMLHDIKSIKQLVDTAITLREKSRTDGDSGTENQITKQLAALGKRLQTEDNVKLAQLTGKKIYEMAVE